MSIKIIKDDYKAFKKEINQFIKMINLFQKEKIYIQEGNIKHKINSNNKKILKATVLLMLYNLVEAIINEIILEITEDINSTGLVYTDAIENVQQSWIKMNCQDSLRLCDKKNFSKKMHNYLNFVINNNPIQFNSLRFYHLVSGNVDSENIRKVCCAYGLNILKNCERLDIIKKKRNELAHGDAKFTEVGGNCTESDLANYKIAIYKHLDFIIRQMERYLRNKEYKIVNKSFPKIH